MSRATLGSGLGLALTSRAVRWRSRDGRVSLYLCTRAEFRSDAPACEILGQKLWWHRDPDVAALLSEENAAAAAILVSDELAGVESGDVEVVGNPRTVIRRRP